MMKKCPKCKQALPLEAFNLNRANKSGRSCYCRLCQKITNATRYALNSEKCRETTKKWREKNPERYRETTRKWREKNSERYRATQRNRHLKSNYGIAIEQYAVLFKRQKGVCQICGRANQDGRRLAIDHCHDTGKIRGLLCNLCNTALGALQDSPSLLRKAAEYLENAKNKKPKIKQ